MTDRYGRPPNFPYGEKLEWLLLTYDPEIGYFKLAMKRRHARALRRVLFGPKGLREAPDCCGGEMKFDLPKGWTLRLTYYCTPDYEVEGGPVEAGDVDAEFIPPASGEKAPARQQEPARPTAEVRP
jgi:hypothetical protein